MEERVEAELVVGRRRIRMRRILASAELVVMVLEKVTKMREVTL